MSRILVSSLLLLFLTTVVRAQPNPDDPPQLSIPLTITDGQTTNTLYFGLDVRASAARDTEPGLQENGTLPPPPPAMDARFYIAASDLESKRDYRFGDGQNLSNVTYTLIIRESTVQGASSTMTISWDLPNYVTGNVQETDGGAAITVMNGNGSVQVQTSAITGVKAVDLVIDYTGIPEGILPVELTSFDAFVQDSRAVLRWETASETNNAGFEVQHQVGGAFQTIGFVEGQGTTTEAQSYSFATQDLPAGRHAFRLKQIDFDGSFAYSEVASADIAFAGAAVMAAAYPNPFNPQTQFLLTIAREQKVAIYVYDMLGRQVQTLFQGTLAPSEAHPFTFEAGSLPSGRYFIRAVGDYFTQAQTVTLLK